jgi:hypothetical protein
MTDINIDQELSRTTKEFGDAYTKADIWIKRKAVLQTDFFNLVTHKTSQRQLAQRSVQLPSVYGDVEEYVKTHHPGFILVAQKGNNLILEQDPAFMKYEYVNPIDGMVYGRTIASGQPTIDLESLKERDPGLWKKYSRWLEPHYSVARGAIERFAKVNHTGQGMTLLPHEIDKKTDQYLEDIDAPRELDVERIIKDNKEYKLERYLIPAPVTVRLVPPRKAKPEELEVLEDECE